MTERDGPAASAMSVGWPATDIADHVRLGKLSPVDVTRAHLDRIDAVDARIGAFQVVRRERALAEATALAARPDLADLPLAGVPVAVKDNLAVEGEPMREGSAGSSDAPQAVDHETVRRLRDAGAIIVGVSRMPELGAWPMTDNVFGIARNPWDPTRTPGGSSGGSAAAVASAMTPIALGNDGGGSVRIPAACCGLIGLKPGRGVFPPINDDDWFGMAENGPLASTVSDCALMLSVLAARDELRSVSAPPSPLRIAVSTKAPAPFLRIDEAFARATRATGELLAEAGHRVEQADPPYPTRHATQITLRWFAAVADDARRLDQRRLERRNRQHVRAGRLVQQLGLVKPALSDRYRAHMRAFFDRFDVLITPTLATIPPRAEAWHRRGWLASLWQATKYAPMTFPWNYARLPAAAVPAGMHPAGVPLSVQIVAFDDGEGRVLSVARQLEELRPWPRHAPL